MNGRQHPPPRPTGNQPIFIGQGQHRTQTSSEGSEWGGEEDENFLFNVEAEYIASQAASKQATTSNGPAPAPLQKFGAARQPVRQMHPVAPPQVRPPQQGPRNNFPPQPRPPIRPSQPNARPPSQFPTPRPSNSNQPQSSQNIPRQSFPPSQTSRNVPLQPQIAQPPEKKMPENLQEALKQIAALEGTTLIQKGEVTNVRLEVKRKEEELLKLRRELEASRRAAQQERDLLKEQHKADHDRLLTDLNFKNQELTEAFSRVTRLETEQKSEGPSTSNGFVPDLKTPQKRLAALDRGNFPTAIAFYDISDSPRIKRQRKDLKEEHAEKEKVLVSKEIQTDAIVSTGPTPQPEVPLGATAQSGSGQGSLARNGMAQGLTAQNGVAQGLAAQNRGGLLEAVPEPTDGSNKAVPRSTQDSTDSDKTIRSYKIVHDLNDSRPNMEEMFTLAVLLQPPPKFEHSSSFELDLDRKKQIDLQLGRSGKLPKKVVNEEIRAILTSSKSEKEAVYPPHIVAQEAIALFVSADKKLSSANKNILMGVLIPVLADHLRQYASFLHNLSALASAGSLNKSTSTNGSQYGGGEGQLGEVSSLTVYFSSLMANSSTSNLRFVEAVERNTKLTLIVLKKLLTFCPELHKFVMRELQPKAVYSDLATHFKELRVFAGEKPEEGEVEHEVENVEQLTEDEPPVDSSADDWLQVREKLSSKYRLDGMAQEEAMVQLTKTPEALKTASAFRLLSVLFDPTQFKIYQKDIVALAASALTALADSVPIDSEDAHQIGDRLLSEEVFINYLASAGGDELTLEPAISLLSVLLKWTWCCPRLCTGDPDTCPLLRLYLNVFTIPQFTQRDVIERGILHKQMLDCLFDIIFAADADKTALLAYPDRHCVISLIHLFVENLHFYVLSLSVHRDCAEEAGNSLQSFQQIILEGVLFLYSMKNRQASPSTFDKMIYLVHHLVQEIIVLLHDELLFEYSAEFQTCLDQLHDDVLHSKLNLAPAPPSDQPMEGNTS